jgi:hypothetical protein
MDISGFTQMTERLMKEDKEGAEFYQTYLIMYLNLLLKLFMIEMDLLQFCRRFFYSSFYEPKIY